MMTSLGDTFPISVGISAILFMTFCADTSGNRGTSFILALSKEIDLQDIRVYVFFSLAGNLPGYVTFSSVTNMNQNLKLFKLGDGNPRSKTLRVDTPFIASNSQKYQSSTVLITSTADIIVIAVTDMNTSGVKGGSGFLVLPVSELSTYYIVITSCLENECFILVASTEDATSVNVCLSFKRTVSAMATLQYGERSYNDGSVLVETLEAFESFQLLADTIDLSGTTISSNKPVAVISGGVFDRAKHSNKKDKVVEQIPPVQGLGTHFVLRGLPETISTLYTVRIAMPHRDTRVNYPSPTSGVQVTSTSSNEILLLVMVDRTIVVTADKPVLVVLELPEPLADGSASSSDRVDAGLTTVMPTSMWKSEFTVFTIHLEGSNMDHTVVLTMVSSCSTIFEINGRSERSSNWLTSGDYKAGSIRLPDREGLVIIGHAACVFGGYAVSLSSFKSFTYPLGWEAQVPLNTNPGSDAVCPHDSFSTSRVDDTTRVTSNNMLTSSKLMPSMMTTSMMTSAERSIMTIPTGATAESMLTSSSIIHATSSIASTSEPSSVRSSATPVIPMPRQERSKTRSSRESGTGSSNAMRPVARTANIGMPSSRRMQLSTDITPTVSSSVEEQHSTQVPTMDPVESTTQEAKESSKSSDETNSYTLRLCPCECTTDMSWIANLTKEQVEKRKKAIFRRLIVDKSTVSKTIRKRISAPDERPSSAGYGSLITGIVAMLVIGFIIIPDVLKVGHVLFHALVLKKIIF